MTDDVVFGVDIGGSGVKGAPVDIRDGSLTEKRRRIATPQPSLPGAVADVVAAILDGFGWKGRCGVTVPGVVRAGIVATAANIDGAWVGTNAQRLLTDRLGVPVTVLNDADAAGLAESRFGAARGVRGLVVVLTFGTGIGSALVHDGRLIPNSELGHLEFRGVDAEHYAAGRLVEDGELDLEWWAERVNEYLGHVEDLFSPDLIVFGGGISKRFEEFSMHIKTRCRLEPAKLRNRAGIVGAALAAASNGEGS